MRNLLAVVSVAVLLSAAAPAEAQLRDQVPVRNAPTSVMDESRPAFLLNRLFSPEHFRMGHSYELSYANLGGSGLTMGTYTNSMMWHFSPRLAARVDVGFAHTPLGTGNFSQQFGGQDSFGRVFLQNAEIAYRPTENTAIHFSFRQSPYGGFMNPYGYHSHYGYDRFGYGMYGGQSRFNARYGTGGGSLFWNQDLR